MTEKRYTYSELNNCQYSVSYTTFEEIYGKEIQHLKKYMGKKIYFIAEYVKLIIKNKHRKLLIC